MLLGIGLYNGSCNYISGCDSIIDNVDYSSYLFNSMEECEQNCNLDECNDGFIEINDFCFHEGDYSFIQKLINNSYASQIDLGCEDWDSYCGSPNHQWILLILGCGLQLMENTIIGYQMEMEL